MQHDNSDLWEKLGFKTNANSKILKGFAFKPMAGAQGAYDVKVTSHYSQSADLSESETCDLDINYDKMLKPQRAAQKFVNLLFKAAAAKIGAKDIVVELRKPRVRRINADKGHKIKFVIQTADIGNSEYKKFVKHVMTDFIEADQTYSNPSASYTDKYDL